MSAPADEVVHVWLQWTEYAYCGARLFKFEAKVRPWTTRVLDAGCEGCQLEYARRRLGAKGALP